MKKSRRSCRALRKIWIQLDVELVETLKPTEVTLVRQAITVVIRISAQILKTAASFLDIGIASCWHVP